MDILALFHWSTLIPWLLGMTFGIFVRATPGLTATMAVALIVPLSYYLPASAGLAMIIGVSFTAIFAGDIPATYLRIPGTPASAAATLDGYQMAPAVPLGDGGPHHDRRQPARTASDQHRPHARLLVDQPGWIHPHAARRRRHR